MESKSSDENCNNPNSELHPSKLIMASHFLRALFRIQHTTTDSSFAGRSRKIRRAAYASMAYSVGTKRAWSSALLRKLRSRSRLRFPNPRRAKYAALPGRPRVARPQQREMDQAEALRELVPGGTSMDDCRLLEETADYIRCLSTQVDRKMSGRRGNVCYCLGGSPDAIVLREGSVRGDGSTIAARN